MAQPVYLIDPPSPPPVIVPTEEEIKKSCRLCCISVILFIIGICVIGVYSALINLYDEKDNDAMMISKEILIDTTCFIAIGILLSSVCLFIGAFCYRCNPSAN